MEAPAEPVKLDELVAESALSQVSRRRFDAGSVIVKRFLGPHAAERARHEAAVLEHLASVPGVVKLSNAFVEHGAIVLCDDDGIPLSEALPCANGFSDATLTFALDITNVVAAMHRLGVVHRDINPTNILVVGDAKTPVLIDFDVATVADDERPPVHAQTEIAGTLAYIAPEQTGRTGQTTDHRADLYALGALFYELATGTTPFEGRDSFDLIRDHLAREPIAPQRANPDVPATLSDVIMRLLQKEPDRRYQSAEGLANDLARLIERRNADDFRSFPIGERDFPGRLLAPTRLIGRDRERATLRAVFSDAMEGRCNGLFVTGAAGAGKTALIDEFRMLVAERGGRYVSGKFDQHRAYAEANPARLNFRRLISILLTEPDEELEPIRARLRAKLGSTASSAVAVLPELGVLLGIEPDTESIETPGRLARFGSDILRSIASTARPLVFVVEDLQWGTPGTRAMFETVMTESPTPGLLLVGAYRAEGVDASHPLGATLARIHACPTPPRHLSLGNLSSHDVDALLREMMRLPVDRAAELGTLVASQTSGNPYDTIEFIDGLRREGALLVGADGWTWTESRIRTSVGRSGSLLSARLDALPPDTRDLLQIVAILGMDVPPALARAASGLSEAEIERRMRPALDDGLIDSIGNDPPAYRFRHDRVKQAVIERVGPIESAFHVRIARRLASAASFDFLAADQYLSGIDAVSSSDEALRVIALFRGVARQEASRGHHTATERLVRAAIALLPLADPGALAAGDVATALDHALHASLFELARFDEADALYESIESKSRSGLEIAQSTRMQIASLKFRRRPLEAIALGMRALRRLSVTSAVEGDVLADDPLTAFRAWIDDEAARSSDSLRPPSDAPELDAAGKIMTGLLSATYGPDEAKAFVWMATESLRLWSRYGPTPALLNTIVACGFVSAALGDYRVGYRIGRHVLDVAASHSFQAHLPHARIIFAISSMHWFEPLESCVALTLHESTDLVRAGRLEDASFAYSSMGSAIALCAATVDEFVTNIDAGLAMSRKAGNERSARQLVPYRQLARALRGETTAYGSFHDDEFDEGAHRKSLGDAMDAAHYHLARAFGALVFGCEADFLEHADAAHSLVRSIGTTLEIVPSRLFAALAGARRARGARAAERDAIVERIGHFASWLHLRAADAPDGFSHLASWMDAERAWIVDDVRSASASFQSALALSQTQRSPAYGALVAERAAAYYAEQGLERYAQLLLLDARDAYDRWGAVAKVRQIERLHPYLEAAASGRARPATVVSSETIDMMGVVRASQALSSETSLPKLRDRVVDLLAGLTGATSVALAVRRDGANDWGVTPPGSDVEISVAEAGARGLLSLAALRFVERTNEPLVLADATQDDRFSRDPYFKRGEPRAMLVLPVSSQGHVRAILMLENRLSRGAFSASRLDAVMVIAGQLAVSLDNALLYASLEDKVAERTEALAAANERLELLSFTDGLTGLANRRGFDEKLQAEWERARDAGTPLALAIVDVDEFKTYNDRYGHPAGDACLKRVAGALEHGMRSGKDLAARYGGEEFALIMPGTNLDGIYAAAERVRREIAAFGVEHRASSHGVLTVSIGVVACVPSTADDRNAYVRAADLGLYEAKRAGRNLVVRVTHDIGSVEAALTSAG